MQYYSVYCLTSSRNFSYIKYIGVTRCNLTVRLKAHIAKRNAKYKICRWINKELSDGFIINIKLLEKGINANDISSKEKKYILQYSKIYDLANLSKGGNGCLGYKYMIHGIQSPYKFTDIHKRNISSSKKGYKKSKEHNYNNTMAIIHSKYYDNKRKPIMCYTKNMEFIKEYSCARQAAREFRPELKVCNSVSAIRRCIRGVISSAYGYKWMLKSA